MQQRRCHTCHKVIEKGQRIMRLEVGEVRENNDTEFLFYFKSEEFYHFACLCNSLDELRRRMLGWKLVNWNEIETV
jgi:hypothetical protein